MANKFIKIPAFGNSMYPFFLSGDILYIRAIPFRNIAIDDFITFVKNDIFITHRVIYVDIKKEYLITKGDTNLLRDKKITAEKIIGKVIKIERNKKVFYPETLYQLQSKTYRKEINQVTKLLTQKKINFLYLKGLPLHLYYKKAIPNRLYGDCDMLVEKKQLQRLEKILLTSGYKKQKTEYSFMHKVLKNKETEINYIKHINSIPVTFDVHVEPTFMMHQLGSLNAFYPETLLEVFSKDLLQHKRFLLVDRVRYPILSATHLIIYLALHLFHHNLQGYYRYDFFRLILAKEKVDRQDILACVQKYQLSSFVYPGFLLLLKYYTSTEGEKIFSDLKKTIQIHTSVLKHVQHIDIFNDDSRITAGIKRFMLLFQLSPHPIHKKITVFFDPAVLYSILWVAVKKAQKNLLLFVPK